MRLQTSSVLLAVNSLLLPALFSVGAAAQLIPFHLLTAPSAQRHTTSQYLAQNDQIVITAAGNSNRAHDVTPANDEFESFKTGRFTKHAQSELTCATYGENQWAGTVDISEERRLFYWYFDSRNDPENDPIIIWLNGGPGGSSLLGLFNEVGPCTFPPNSTATVPNDFSWNNNASLIFIDQPAGVGFSTLKPGTPIVSGDVEGARDLQTFLRLFFRDVFPEKAHLPIHLTGESYGGHYVPFTVAEILKSREQQSPDAFWGDLKSMVLVNSLLHDMQVSMGMYQLMCTNYRGKLWNATTCNKLRMALPEIEAVAAACDMSHDGRICSMIQITAQPYAIDVLWEEVAARKRSCYNIQLPCPAGLEELCYPANKGNFTVHLNEPEVLEALGFPKSFIYYSSSAAAAAGYGDSYDFFRPTMPLLASILDWTHKHPQRNNNNISTPIRLLVLNGNEDAMSNTPGQKWVYEKLSWSGAAGYRAAQWKSLDDLGFPEMSSSGPDDGEEVRHSAEWKASEDEQLVFMAIDGAGHMVPQDQPVLADKIMRRWIKGWHDNEHE